jgi:hypothetical protein
VRSHPRHASPCAHEGTCAPAIRPRNSLCLRTVEEIDENSPKSMEKSGGPRKANHAWSLPTDFLHDEREEAMGKGSARMRLHEEQHAKTHCFSHSSRTWRAHVAHPLCPSKSGGARTCAERDELTRFRTPPEPSPAG